MRWGRLVKRQRALDAIFLRPTDRIPHRKSLTHPAFEQRLTGIDPWEHPRLARERMLELLPQDVGRVPDSDEPVERPPEGHATSVDLHGLRSVRWSAGRTVHWDHGRGFRSIEPSVPGDA